MALHFVIAAARHAPDLAVDLVEQQLPPIVLYTDASDESGNTRIGAKMLLPGELPRVTVWGPLTADKQHCGDQETVINQAELHAALLSICTWGRFFAA